MGLRALFIVVIVATTLAPALATSYIVGDAAGWKLGVNYTEWAKGKDFTVGDTLTFTYKPQVHNVLKVNGSDFQSCVNTNLTQVPSTSGNDTIHLATPGKKWYICDVAGHCLEGMKLVITVSAAPEGPAPAPIPWTPKPNPVPGAPPPSAAVEVSPLKSFAWMLAAVVAAIMV